MRYLLAVIFLAISCVPAMSATVTKSINEHIREIIVARDARAVADNLQEAPWSQTSWEEPVRNQPLLDAETLSLVNLAKGTRVEYANGLIASLNSSVAFTRGVACEMFALIHQPAAIEPLGRLLDDNSASATTIRRNTPQSGPDIIHLSNPTVSQLARHALWRHTGILFRSKADFEVWWKANRNYENRIWYWAARWNFYNYHIPGTTDRSDLPGAEIASATGLPPNLPKDMALKILLLHKNDAALGAECAPYAATRGVRLDLSYGTGQGPYPDVITAFIRANHLKARVIELLSQKNLWPEVSSEDAFYSLISKIDELSPDIFTAADEPKLAAAQRVVAPYSVSVEPFVLMRALVAPAKARALFTESLMSNPRMITIACRLAEEYGSQDGRALTNAFSAAESYEKQRIAESLLSAAKRGIAVTPAFIAGLAGELSYETDTAGATSDYAIPVTLAKLATIANAVTGTVVATDDDLEALTPHRTKGPLTDEMINHNAGVATAFDRVKAKLMTLN